jgi:hypothetical protein
MQRDDPIQEPWYELDFRMTRWQCPSDLPKALLGDVIEAIQDLDSILLSAARLVDRYSFGLDASLRRFIPEVAYEELRGEFELMEDRLSMAQAELRVRWAALTTEHADVICQLPDATKGALQSPNSAYSMGFSLTDAELDDTYKQFLAGIHGDHERYMAAT